MTDMDHRFLFTEAVGLVRLSQWAFRLVLPWRLVSWKKHWLKPHPSHYSLLIKRNEQWDFFLVFCPLVSSHYPWIHLLLSDPQREEETVLILCQAWRRLSVRGAKEGRQQKSGYVNPGGKKSEKERVNLNVEMKRKRQQGKKCASQAGLRIAAVRLLQRERW